jgi:hypothetical protein
MDDCRLFIYHFSNLGLKATYPIIIPPKKAIHIRPTPIQGDHIISPVLLLRYLTEQRQLERQVHDPIGVISPMACQPLAASSVHPGRLLVLQLSRP